MLSGACFTHRSTTEPGSSLSGLKWVVERTQSLLAALQTRVDDDAVAEMSKRSVVPSSSPPTASTVTGPVAVTKLACMRVVDSVSKLSTGATPHAFDLLLKSSHGALTSS
jgi:hypothetical protein